MKNIPLVNETGEIANLSSTMDNGSFDATVVLTDVYNCPLYAQMHADFTQIGAVRTIVIIAYLLTISLAIFGNILVIWTIWRNTHMHTVTNYYLVNLAISDFLVSAFVMPLKLLEYTSPCQWQIFSNDGLCSFLSYTLPIFVFTSVLTLVAISLERYYAIVHPLSAMKVNSKSRTRRIIAATWVIPILVASPYLYCESYSFSIRSDHGVVTRQICTDRFDELDGHTGKFRKGFFIILFIVMYCIPMVIIIGTCTKIAVCLIKPINIENSPLGRRDSKRRHEVNKRKVARMVIVIAVAFIVAWSPQYIVSIVSQLQTESFLLKSNFLFTMLMTHLFGFINSCVNPFIYTVMSEKFRKSFKRTLRRLFCNYFYCQQRIRTYRNSIMQRRSTAVITSATKSFLDHEEDQPSRGHTPLLRQAMNKKTKEFPSSSSDSSGKSRSKFWGDERTYHRIAYTACQDSVCFTSKGCDKNKSMDLMSDHKSHVSQELAGKETTSKGLEMKSDSDYGSCDKLNCETNVQGVPKDKNASDEYPQDIKQLCENANSHCPKISNHSTEKHAKIKVHFCNA